jgi:hypothetical protein
MTDLGTKYDHGAMSAPIKESKKMDYPKLCIRDKSLEAAFGKDLPDVGEEIEATVKLVVTGIRNDQYGKSVDFDVVSGDFSEPAEDEGVKDAGEEMPMDEED